MARLFRIVVVNVPHDVAQRGNARQFQEAETSRLPPTSYDALGHRTVKQVGPTSISYLHDPAGNVVTEWCTDCAGYTGPAAEYIFLSGNFVAEYKNDTTYFIHQDHLGSTRLATGLNQAVVQNLDYLPFGELNSTDSGITTHEFTGDEQDAETDLAHTQFRQYSSSMGRWMTPDPAGLAAVDPTDPQMRLTT